MQRIHTQIIHLVLASLLGFASIFASGIATAYNPREEVHTGAMIADAIAVRPLMFGALIVGTFTFVVSSPLSAFGGNIEESFEQMVLEPAKYTFVRPLGHMEDEPLSAN